jgi:hypothetical protein
VEAKDARRRFTLRTLAKLSLGFVFVTCCAPMGIIGTLYATVYAIEMDAPKYSVQPLPVGQRPSEGLTPMQVYMDLRDTEDRSLKERKTVWREKYEGRWVSWKGTVAEVRIFDNLASELDLHSEAGEKFPVQVNFDPLHNARLQELRKGQEVQVSGRLWGYYFMGDTARLSEGVLLDPEVKGQAQEPPL